MDSIPKSSPMDTKTPTPPLGTACFLHKKHHTGKIKTVRSNCLDGKYFFVAITVASIVLGLYFAYMQQELRDVKSRMSVLRDDLSQFNSDILDLLETSEDNVDLYQHNSDTTEYNDLLERTKRNTRTKENKRSRNNRRRKGREKKGKERVFSMGGVHLWMKEDRPEIIKEVRKSGIASVSNGFRTRKGLYHTSFPPQGATYTFWEISSYSQNISSYTQNTSLADYANGHLLIRISGLYKIYAQMTQADVLGNPTFEVKMKKGEVEKVLVKCSGLQKSQETSTAQSFPLWSHCFTNTIVHLKKDDEIFITSGKVEEGHDRLIKTDHDLTYWGIIRLAPF